MLSLQHFMHSIVLTNMEQNSEHTEYLACSVLPDAVRAYTGLRQYSHFEISEDKKDCSYIVFPSTPKQCTKDILDACPKHLVENIKPCVIGEDTLYTEFYRLHNTETMDPPMFEGIFTHLIQDAMFDFVVRSLVDCSRRYDDIFVYKKTGEHWNGKQMRKFIEDSEQYGIYVLAELIYKKHGEVTNNKWVQNYVKSVLEMHYPEDLAKKTLSFMKIDDKIDKWITNKEFDHFEDAMITKEEWLSIYKTIENMLGPDE